MVFFINGGEFNNKGAEAMTLVAIYEIRKRFPNAKIYLNYQPGNSELERSINIDPIYLNNYIFRILNSNSLIERFTSFLLNVRLGIFNKKYYTSISKSRKVLSSVDYYIDISGFSLSSKWGYKNSVLYLDKIDCVKRLSPKSKVYLMPQSFGPFDYKDKSIIEHIKTTLNKCSVVFVREQSGYSILDRMGVFNKKLSCDSVLQTPEIKYYDFISEFKKLEEDIIVHNEKSIGIIPNYRLIDTNQFDEEKMIGFYCSLIDNLREYTVYLIGHAGEDLILCKKIKSKFLDNDNIIVIDHVLNSFNYQKLASKLRFIIASRYHSIVHAYKEGTPALILGWADKYNEIATKFNQQKYIINMEDTEKSIQSLFDIMNNYESEKTKILDILKEIQRESCYVFLDDK